MTEAIAYRWIGTSQETLRQLLAAVLRLDDATLTDARKLDDAVYHLYESNSEASRSVYATDTDVDNDIRSGIQIPTGVHRSRQDAETSFLHYANSAAEAMAAAGRRKRRVAVHTHPHGAVALMNELVATFAAHPSVYDIKIAGTRAGIETRLDTLIVYCYLDDTHVVDAVIAFLRERENRLLPGSPAMMAPTGVQGVATADQTRGGSWGTTRTSTIALWAHALRHGGSLTLDNLVHCVEGAFRSAGIDPANPAEYL